MKAAAEVGVKTKEGYNGHLTSREAGSVGGQMVRRCVPYELRIICEMTELLQPIKSKLNT